jgi:hypothetical protein
MRMEISREEFMKLLQQPRQQGKTAAPAEETEGSTIDLSQLDPVITNLIHVALINAEARGWLTQQDWKNFLSGEPNAELLVKVLAQEITPGDNTAINSWLATLPGNEEWAIRRILEKGVLPISQPSKNDAVSKRPEEASGISWHPLKTAQDAWVALRRRQDNRHLEAIYARLRQPGLSDEEVTVLQKQILDIQKRNT